MATTTTRPAPQPPTSTTTTPTSRLTAAQQAAQRTATAANPPAGSPQPAPTAPEPFVDTESLSAGGFDENADVSKMSPQEQAQWYATYNQRSNARDAAAQAAQAAATGAPPPPVTAKPSDAEIRKGGLSEAQIATLSYQEQLIYKQQQAVRDKAANDPFKSDYTAPPPVKAEDYVSPDHFVSQVYDEKTGTYHAATAADIQKSTDWDVTKEQTVQGQMETLTKDLANNPVYQSIADAMRRSAAAAGGGNSLMAESAAYDKVIGLAFNIATSDAATYAKSAEFNASMKNQFSLANNNFVYQALLSDQNYAQSQVLQSEQIKGNIDSVDRQIAGQLESTKIAGKAQVMAAQAQAGGMVASANIQADASTKNAALAAKTQLQMGELERRNMLDAAEISHEGRMQELQYGAESDLGKMAFGATIDKDAYQYKADDTFVKQTLLFDRQDTSTDLTNMASRLHDAQMQPGITPAQLARYTQDEVSNYTTNTALKTAKTLSIIDSMKSASGAGSGSDAVTPDNPYGKWSNYLNYKAPTPGPLPFYEGHTPGTAYAPAIPDLDKPFVPGLPVPG